MNNILSLYNIEFKRIYKWLLALLGVLVAGNIFIFLDGIKDTINAVSANLQGKPNISMLKLQEAKYILGEFGIYNMKHLINLLLGLCVLICLSYALIIWYRDVIGKSKTGYTLFMLPQNKINVYIAKALTVITMIYITTLTQIALFTAGLSAIKSLVGFTSEEMNLILYSNARRDLCLIQPYLIDFIMINVVGVILAVVVIFTGVMLQKSFKVPGIVLGVVYIIGSIGIFFYLLGTAQYTDRLLMYHVGYSIVLFLVSIGLSYTLLNKKVYI